VGLSAQTPGLRFAVVDRPVQLSPPDGPPLQARLLELGFRTVVDGSTHVEAILEVAAADYPRIEDEHLFHLRPDVRGPGAAGFRPDGPVTLEVVGDAGLVPQLAALGEEPMAAGRALAEQPATSPLLATEAWYAGRVMSDVALPDGMEGVLRQGFRTSWAPDDGLGDGQDEALGLPALAVLEEVLAARGWRFRDIPGRDAVGWDVISDAGAWECYAIADAQPGLLLIYSVLTVTVPPPRRPDAAVLLTRLNFGLPVGAWELDLDDGTLRHRTSIDAPEGLGVATCDRLLERNLDVVATHLPALAGFAAGELDIDGAVAAAGG
jgi:hypothetical protein